MDGMNGGGHCGESVSVFTGSNKKRAGNNNSGNRARGEYAEAAGNESNNRHLENMSESALNNLIAGYKKEILATESNEDKNLLQLRILAIKTELNKRGISDTMTENNPDSPLSQRKAFAVSSAVGISTLAFGVIGFIGAVLSDSKHPFKWGITAAGLGAAAAFFLYQDNSFKVIKPV